jgi:two-component system response regulator GlrR
MRNHSNQRMGLNSRKDAKFFLFDLNPASGLAGTLKEILESFSVNIQIQKDSLSVKESMLFNNSLHGIITQFNPDVVFLVLHPVHLKQLSALLQSINNQALELPIIVVIEGVQPDDIIELLKIGIIDFITPPLKKIDIIPRLWRLLEQKNLNEKLTHLLKERIGLKQLVGKDPVFLTEIKKIPLVAKCNASVLITGETGTGKELCARAIHYLSPRANKPFIPVNCGAIPMELVENELFGHVQGAFTGASKSFSGLIQEANGGTLFLDEISCLPLQAQVKLLRFLQDKVYRQLGSSKMHQADVRVLVATNIELEEAINEGKFRRDLYYRLNIIPLLLPPLRERREDIPLLARHFGDKYVSEFDKQAKDFTSEAMQKLIVYEWPGNIRELENVIERAIVFSKESVIQGADIVLPRSETTAYQESFKVAKTKTISQFEKDYIKGLLLSNQGNITKAAKAAQKNRRAFWALIRKYKIDIQSFKSAYS